MEHHPIADLFPMLAEDELAELAEDIKQRGQLQPIVLDADGRVLDGRNRLVACERVGVEPEFVSYDGEDPDGYALAVNIARRHLSTGARAVIAARAARMNGVSYKSVTDDEVKVNKVRLSEAVLVLDWAPDLADAVVAGTKPLSVALETARERKAEAARLEAKLNRLRADAEDLAALVDEERMDVDDAVAALDSREEKAREEEEQRRSEADRRAAEARERAGRMSESLRTAINVLNKTFGTDDLREQISGTYVDAPVASSEVNQNITADDLRAAAEVCADLAARWEKR